MNHPRVLPCEVEAPPAASCRSCGAAMEMTGLEDWNISLCPSCRTRPADSLKASIKSRLVSCDDASAKAAPASSRATARAARGWLSGDAPAASPRSFSDADRSLIRRLNGYMPAHQLLVLLNERLVSDIGHVAATTACYTMEQLHAEIADQAMTNAVTPRGGHDWASLRKLLAQARRSGVLQQASEQVIDDFAVVFSLNAKQLLSLREVVQQALEDRE